MTLVKYIVYATCFFYPLSYFTFFSNPSDISKYSILALTIVVSIITWFTHSFFKGNFVLKTTKVDIYIILLFLVYLASAFFSNSTLSNSLILPGGAGFILLSGMLFILINQLSNIDKKTITNVLIVSGFIFSVVQIISYFRIFPSSEIFIKDFNLFGSHINSFIFLLALLPLILDKLIENKDIPERILLTLVGIFYILSLLTISINYLNSHKSNEPILNGKIGWSIAIDSIKSNPTLGAGSSNFIQAFQLYKPIEFNQMDWSNLYIYSSNSILTIITESGIIGLIAFLVLLVAIISFIKKSKTNLGIKVSAFIFIIATLVLPMAYALFPIMYIVFALNVDIDNTYEFKSSNGLSITLLIITFITILGLYYVAKNLIYADYLYTESIKNTQLGNGTKSYELIYKSIGINPDLDKTRVLASGINLALAESLSNSENLTDEDKKNITILIQQAIQEAKSAVSINPNISLNWLNLSNIYYKISPVAQGSLDFAIESINQAIALDPINPSLRIQQANYFFLMKDYELAIESLKLAVLAKPNLPNAHYNLALVYKANNQIDKAKESINITLSLLGKESLDYEVAIKELENIEELTNPEDNTNPIPELYESETPSIINLDLDDPEIDIN